MSEEDMTADTNMVDFDPAKRDRLRSAYIYAKNTHQSVFVFEGDEYYTKYAMYLLEHLDNVFGPPDHGHQ